VVEAQPPGTAKPQASTGAPTLGSQIQFPRWVSVPGAGAVPRAAYVTGIIVIVLALLFVLMHLTGGGGPGLHTPPAGGH